MHGTHGARKHRIGNGRRTDTHVQGNLTGPFTCPFLLGRVQNHFNQGIACFRILVRQNVGGNVNQITAEFTLTPLAKNRTHLHGGHAQTFHERIGFANHLHVGIFNAVVHHLDKVPCTTWPHPFATGLTIVGLSGDSLQKRTYQGPRFWRTARHQSRAVQSPFFAATHTSAHEQDTSPF